MVEQANEQERDFAQARVLALKRERVGYVTHGQNERTAQVDAELRRFHAAQQERTDQQSTEERTGSEGDERAVETPPERAAKPVKRGNTRAEPETRT